MIIMAKTIKRVKRTKKVDVKRLAKATLSQELAAFLTEKGYDVHENHEDFGFTGGTLVVGMKDTDVQLKLITPKAGLERYQQVVYVDEDEFEALEAEKAKAKEDEDLPDEDVEVLDEDAIEEDDRQEA